jgi:hypothetical protein
MRLYVQSVGKLSSGEEELVPQIVHGIDNLAFPYMLSKWQAQGKDLLFRTKKGFRGICGGPCAKGDQVWALRNAHVPFALREISTPHGLELVGSCFILDKMKGEMIREAEQVETIRLV